MVKSRVKEKTPKKLVLGDDAIEDFEADWFDFKTPASALADHLYRISKSSGVCCGIFGSWGSGKSSFMKLMDRHVRTKYSANICVAWFTAWDPGGIEDLGDAMLYRFFHGITKGEKDLIGTFRGLQEALGIRKSFRERARQALNVVSQAMPETTTKGVLSVAGGLLAELDSPERIKDSFDRLMEWLEKNDKTVFFFVDDIDRATGEQIRDILSEVKVYVSHRRIVVVLGYDESYVVGALKPVLPHGIEPKIYLEKIVTIGRHLPVPGQDELVSFAAKLLSSTLKLENGTANRLASVAWRLSFGNPRRLKSLILTSADSLSVVRPQYLTPHVLESSLIVCASVEMGLVSNEKVREALDSGDEQSILAALKEFSEKHPEEAEKANILTSATDELDPNFQPGILRELRLLSSSWEARESLYGPREREVERLKLKSFSWRQSFAPILEEAASHGFKISSQIAAPHGITIPSSTKVQIITLSDLPIIGKIRGVLREANLYKVSLEETDMAVLVVSDLSSAGRDAHISPREGVYTILNQFLDESACLVSEKEFVLWWIDDINAQSKEFYSVQAEIAEKRSRGLKHPFIFCYTLQGKMRTLLALLLKAATRKIGEGQTASK